MLTLLLATALAVPSGGLRLDTVSPGVQLGVRDVWVARENGPDGVHQTTLDIQVPVPLTRLPLVAEVSVPTVHSWNHGEQNIGLGQVRLAGRVWAEMRGEAGAVGVMTWGFELAVPTRLQAPDGSYGLHAVEAMPALEALYVLQIAARTLKGAHLHLRGGLGLIVRQRAERLQIWPPAPMLDLGAALVHPIRATPFGIGNELAVLTDSTPLATRHFFRTDYGRGFTFDIGMQVPWIETIRGPRAVQVVGQLRWRPAR